MLSIRFTVENTSILMKPLVRNHHTLTQRLSTRWARIFCSLPYQSSLPLIIVIKYTDRQSHYPRCDSHAAAAPTVNGAKTRDPRLFGCLVWAHPSTSSVSLFLSTQRTLADKFSASGKEQDTSLCMSDRRRANSRANIHASWCVDSIVPQRTIWTGWEGSRKVCLISFSFSIAVTHLGRFPTAIFDVAFVQIPRIWQRHLFERAGSCERGHQEVR